MTQRYSCSKCGKPNSSDGEHFCGHCEEEYQTAEAIRLREAYQKMLDRWPYEDQGFPPTFHQWARGEM